MMIAGVLAFGFAVAGVSSAGATGAANPAHHSCERSYDTGTTGAVAGAIYKGCNEPTTTWNEQCGCSTTTTTYQHCGCSTTTTQYATTTSSTTTSTTMAPSTSMAPSTTEASTTTSTTEVTTTTGDTSTTDDTTPDTQGFVPPGPSISVEGVTSTLPSVTVAGTSAQLPFTGGSPFPLAGLGLVLVGTGAGLARRKRRLA